MFVDFALDAFRIIFESGTNKQLQFVSFLTWGQTNIAICIMFESGTKDIFESGTKQPLQFVTFLSLGQKTV